MPNLHTEDKEARVLSFFLPPVWDTFFESMSIPQPSNRHHSEPSSTFWLQHRSSYERKAPQRMQILAGSGAQSVKRYEKSARLAAKYLALPRRTRLIETFAPLAEGAILGTSQGSASPTSEAPVHFASLCSLRCCGQSHSSMWSSLLLNL